MLTFDEASHTYYWDGQPVPNVTRVLAGLVSYDHVNPDVLQRAQWEGTQIHKLVELDAKGELDIQALYTDPDQAWLVPRFEAWRRFVDESGFECLASERRLFHPVHRYAGTADLFGICRHLKNIKGPVNIDVKRSFFGGKAIGLQTAGYTAAWNHDHPKDERVPDTNRFALRLDADGKYRLRQFDDRNDFAVWTAQLVIHRWKEAHHDRT